MSKERVDHVKMKLENDVKLGLLTPEEVIELGLWVTGQGMKGAWNKAIAESGD